MFVTVLLLDRTDELYFQGDHHGGAATLTSALRTRRNTLIDSAVNDSKSTSPTRSRVAKRHVAIHALLATNFRQHLDRDDRDTHGERDQDADHLSRLPKLLLAGGMLSDK